MWYFVFVLKSVWYRLMLIFAIVQMSKVLKHCSLFLLWWYWKYLQFIWHFKWWQLFSLTTIFHCNFNVIAIQPNDGHLRFFVTFQSISSQINVPKMIIFCECSRIKYNQQVFKQINEPNIWQLFEIIHMQMYKLWFV